MKHKIVYGMLALAVLSLLMLSGCKQPQPRTQEIWEKADTIRCINEAIDSHPDLNNVVEQGGYRLTGKVFYIKPINEFIFEAVTYYNPVVTITFAGECIGNEAIIVGKENFDKYINNKPTIELVANLRSGDKKIERLFKR